MGKTPYARTSLTMPAGLLAGADRLAREWGRSRSWVIATALEALVRSSLGKPPGDPAPRAGIDDHCSHRPADQLLGFPTFEAYREWCGRTHADSTPLDTTRLRRLRRALEQEGARFVIDPGHLTTAGPVQLRIGTDIANARAVLRGLHQAGFALAREVMAEAIVTRTVTVIGVDPRVDVLVAAESPSAPELSPPRGGREADPT